MGIAVLNPSYNAVWTPRSLLVAAIAVTLYTPDPEREKRRFNRWKRR